MVYVCYYWSHMATKVPNQFYLLEKNFENWDCSHMRHPLF